MTCGPLRVTGAPVPLTGAPERQHLGALQRKTPTIQRDSEPGHRQRLAIELHPWPPQRDSSAEAAEVDERLPAAVTRTRGCSGAV